MSSSPTKMPSDKKWNVLPVNDDSHYGKLLVMIMSWHMCSFQCRVVPWPYTQIVELYYLSSGLNRFSIFVISVWFRNLSYPRGHPGFLARTFWWVGIMFKAVRIHAVAWWALSQNGYNKRSVSAIVRTQLSLWQQYRIHDTRISTFFQ